MRLHRAFFAQPSLTVAKKLLGKILVRKIGRRIIEGKIVETESYPGPYDRASHAFNYKKTPRNRAEYLVGGHVYIYLVYGMYWQLNISTGKAGYPECVLIRALEPITNDQRLTTNDIDSHGRVRIAEVRAGRVRRRAIRMLANGPGKLCRWLKLNKSFYSEDITASKRIWIETRGKQIPRGSIACGPRIGIDYAGPKWARKPWRFFIKGNCSVSR